LQLRAIYSKAIYGRREGLGAYLDAIINANYKTFLEVYGMLIDTLDEIFAEAGIVPVWVERGMAQGIEQGMEKGIKQGIEQDRLEIARKMKSMGDSVERIQIITGLSFETIEQLEIRN
jgi:predicted transposase/invertase (TIGR01784 family)